MRAFYEACKRYLKRDVILTPPQKAASMAKTAPLQQSENNSSVHALEQLDGLQRRDLARRHVDAAETWLRNIIHQEFTSDPALGPDYLTTGPWKSGIKEIATKIAADPTRYNRPIDASSFEQAVYLFCHPTPWKQFFKEPFEKAYPLGAKNAEHYLTTLVNIRNDVQHGRTCDARKLEKAICYSNDFVDGCKDLFQGKNRGREFNVPTFVRFEDNLGNSGDPRNGIRTAIGYTVHCSNVLRPGDILTVEADVDPSFDGFTVDWRTGYEERIGGNFARIELTNRHVGEYFQVTFSVTGLHPVSKTLS
jgi:hypothetical protein